MPEPSRADICAIAVMAKAPQPGRSKTRLVPPLTPEQASALSAAFLRDVTENVALAARRQRIIGLIAYAPAGLEPLFAGHLAPGTGFVLADGNLDLPPAVRGFGKCLLHAIQTLLADGYGSACVLNSDSPNLPTAALERAAAALSTPGERIVLGAADDGGYYLLGLKTARAHMFEDIDWSTERVADQTRARAATLGLPLVELEPWYDVDDRPALNRLIAELDVPGSGYAAPASSAVIERFGLRRLLGWAA